MPLASVPAGAPGLPGGAQKVSLKNIDPTAAATNKIDVTTLSSTQREYADPPLLDSTAAGGGTITATCTASGLLGSSGPAVTPVVAGQTPTGWVCTDAELTYEVGKYVAWSASYSYYD